MSVLVGGLVRPGLKKFNLHNEFNLIRMIFHQTETSVRLLCARLRNGSQHRWKLNKGTIRKRRTCLSIRRQKRINFFFRSATVLLMEIEICIRCELKSHFDVHFVIVILPIPSTHLHSRSGK